MEHTSNLRGQNAEFVALNLGMPRVHTLTAVKYHAVKE